MLCLCLRRCAVVMLCVSCAAASAETFGERLFNRDLREHQRQSHERERQADAWVFGAPAQTPRKCTFVPVRGYLDDRQTVARPGWQTVYVRQCR